MKSLPLAKQTASQARVAPVIVNRDLERLVRERTHQLETTNEVLKEQSRALRDAQENLDNLLSESPVVLLRSTPGILTYTYVSPNFNRIFGYGPADPIDTPAFLSSVIHPDDVERFRSEFASVLDEHRSPETDLEFRLRHKDGKYRQVHAVIRSVSHGPDGGESRYVYLTDITLRTRSLEALEDAKREAERANLAKSEFLSRMSHELRTPLNAILGFGELMQLDARSESDQEYLRYILGAGRHLLDLINEVLDLARIEADRLSLSVEPVLLSQILAEAIALVRPAAAHYDIQVRDVDDAYQRHVSADQQRLKQVLLNILGNAVKYNRPGGSIVVTCEEQPDNRLRIRVTDSGAGIPEDQLDRVFRPFDRLGAENTEIEGTGLGLALSKRLMEAMGGTIGVESAVGEGSTFWAELPLVDGPAVQLESAPPAADESTQRSAAIKRKILYVEDNLSNLKLIEGILARRPWIELLPAMQGGLSLELARDHSPDLILLDLHLPDIGGDEVLRRLRENPATSSIPVIMVSADATQRQIERLLAAGAHAYVTKPINVAEFLNLIDELIAEEGVSS